MIKQANELAEREVVRQELFSMRKVKVALSELIAYFSRYGIDLKTYEHLDGSSYFWFMAKEMIAKASSQIFWTATHIFALQVLLIGINPYFIESEMQKVVVSEVAIEPSGEIVFRYSLYFFNQLSSFLDLLSHEDCFVLDEGEVSESSSPPLSDAGSLASSASSSPMSAFQMLRESRVSPQEWKK